MDLSESQREHLRRVTQEILASLEKVADRAAEALQVAGPTNATVALATPGNPMTGGGQDVVNVRTARSQVRDNLQRILGEPFTARVVVRWEDGSQETYYVTKGSAASLGGRLPDLKLATYASPLGRLSELPEGASATLIRNRSECEFEIIERTLLRPTRAERWDAVGDTFEFDRWRAALESLRRFLEVGGPPPSDEELDVLAQLRAEGEGVALVRETLRRRVVDRMALRDQPALDRYQGEVFRMPLDRQVLLVGPPGSGKTTTLIQRLSGKRNPEGLTEDEAETLERTGLEARFREPNSWAMFSPTELLQLYLRDAFNREKVPAGPTSLRMWERERRDLARNVFGILRVNADSPGFELDDEIRALRVDSSSAISEVHDKFVEFCEKFILDRVTQAFDVLAQIDDVDVSAAAQRVRRKLSAAHVLEPRDLFKLIDDAEELRGVAARLRKETGNALDRLANRMLRNHGELLNELVSALPDLRTPTREDDEDDEDDESEDSAATRTKSPELMAAEILIGSLRTRARVLARGRRQLSGRAARVFQLVGPRAPSDTELTPIGSKLITITELRVVVSAPRRIIMGLPAIYRRFRSAHNELFVGALDRAKLSGAECDIMLLAALRSARRVFLQDRRRLQAPVIPTWLESIRQRYLMQVFVDEATDFSAVQLACMLELAHPTVRSWFACGDFRQRITMHGYSNREELAWIASRAELPEIEARDISTGYRQSFRLRQLTHALESAAPLAPESAGDLEDDIDPLLFENTADTKLADWISERISEIEQAIGRLPSIAVFVNGDHQIDPLVELVRPRLAAHNIAIVGCKDGRVVGDRQEVRVFDVQHIKGLEFEAVFFVAIDQLYRRVPQLFERFLYVGVTRAATYLAITCEGVLPDPLERVRAHFSTGTWAK